MKVIIDIPNEAVEMLKDMATALQTIAKTITVEQSKQEEKTFSLEEVRAKLIDLSRKGKREEVKGLIKQFDVQRLTDVPKTFLSELMRKAEEIDE
ncbi:hypothetical protein [Seinonella peptonophila]|nr:hypothetical protein [Seinonella peptonophila]